MPASTEGPSGPKLFPVPRVAMDANALREKRWKSFLSDGIGTSPTHVTRSDGGVALDDLIESRSTSFSVSLRPGGISPNLNNPPTMIPPITGIAHRGNNSANLKEKLRISSPPPESSHNIGLNNGNLVISPSLPPPPLPRESPNGRNVRSKVKLDALKA